MTITNTAKNRIRDLIADDISTGALGTGTTSPSSTDTDLEAKETATEKSVTVTTGEQQLNVKYILSTTEGNGKDYTEFGVYFSNGDLLSRLVFPVFSKTENVELHIAHTINIL